MPHSSTPVIPFQGTFTSDLRGVHFDFLRNRIPAWFSQASAQRKEELGGHELQLPAWYRTATPEQKTTLAHSHTRYREILNQIDARLGSIKDVFEFAEQPLKDAIKAQFKLDLDVRNVYFARKYAFKDRDDLFGLFVFDQQNAQDLNYQYRGTSLLEAALANFEPGEETPLRCNDCQLITDWGSYDGDVIATFEALSSQARPIPAHEFAKLCRTLDLGALYQKHIKDIVEPEDSTERDVLKSQLEELHRQRLAVCTEIARHPTSPAATSAISTEVYLMLRKMLNGDSPVTLDGKPLTFATLKVFGIELTGPMLIGPNRKNSDRVERLVVYLPNDPLQPLKEYASSAEFMADLRTRLHGAAYRRYFSQFIPLRHQGTFFGHFNRLYKPDGVDVQADYPPQPRPVKLAMNEAFIEGDLWQQLRQKTLDKVYADAQAVAVPTDEENRAARMSRLESYFDAVINVYNLAAFIVPGVGPMMLTVGAAQMCDEAFEGIEAYERDEPREMWAHFSSVALNVAMLATGATVLPKVQLSSVVDALRPVTLDNDTQKLWNPDLSKYKAPVTLAAEASPDDLGLYAHEGKKVLPLDDDHYLVKPDPSSERFRIQHPTRPEAYAPELVHNGEGAWHHELEQPLSWKDTKLMRRLGPLVQGFSDAQLAQILRVSGVDPDVLRRLHIEGEPVPAILLHTIRRFRAHADAEQVARGIGEGSLRGQWCDYPAILAVELPGWPANKALEVFSDDGLNGPSIKHGNSDASPENTVKVSRADLMQGRLPERIIASLSEPEVKSLLPHYTPRTTQERVTALRQQLQARAVSARTRLIDSLYSEPPAPASTAASVVQRDFTGLPTSVIEELLADATLAEMATLNTARRVPLRLAEGARRLQQQVRLSRAYEGLYLDALIDKGTETLALNSLKALPGWVNDLRLEVREGRLEGELRASFGPEDATERKVLLRMEEGRYETRNARDEHLHGADDLYSSIQHALPDRHREAIGLPHVTQGTQLKAKIIEHQLSPDQLRPLLNMRPRRQPFFRPPMRLSGERIGYPLSDHPQATVWGQIVEERVRALYPSMPAEQVDGFIQSMGDRADAILRNREREYKQLTHTLQNWQRAQLDGVSDAERATADFSRKRGARLAIIRALDQAWRRTGEVDLDSTGQAQGQLINLADKNLRGQLDELPPLTANFGHVSHLDLSGTGIEGSADGFLHHFKRLRKLDLSNNDLIALPVRLGQMKHLTELDLSDNLIEVDAQAITQLSKLTHLKFLGLEGNPLKLPPDIGQMPDLLILLLADTGIHSWPVGVFDQVRPRTFLLDLRNNPLEVIPQAEPGSAQAEVVARTLISHEPANISAQNLQRVREYRQSVGFEPNRPTPPFGVIDSRLWKEGLTDAQWQANQERWADLEREPGSEPFFNELRKLAQSQDALAGSEAARAELCQRVWSMVEAAAANTALREKLFRMAAAPTTCVDAGAQLFNAMGLEVLIVQAYELAAHDLIETRLLELAQGKSRLDELGRIARERVRELVAEGRKYPEFDDRQERVPHFDTQGRPLPDIDEVEIHMIYPTRLAQRLDLPWQSRAMMFNEPDVSTGMIERAYARVLEKEQGAQLQARLIEQPFWVEFLEKQHAVSIKDLRARSEPLLDLQTAQQAWVDSATPELKTHWRTEVLRLARQLGKPDSEVTPGTVISDAQYFAEMEAIAAQETALIGKLTAQAIRRAKLQ